MSVDEVEPIEEEAADENAVAPRGTHLASTQTVTHEYLTQSGKVMRETVKTDGTVTSVLDFIYDESGKPFAMVDQLSAQPKTYYYVLNLQGDVVKLIDQDGAEVASYEYDAWGNILASSGSMAEKNPLRYRGYYYDGETGFYYLQSRYYDPATRRFINADSFGYSGQNFLGANIFAYCNNCPVKFVDENGHFAIIGTIASILIGGLILTTCTGCSSRESFEDKWPAEWEYKYAPSGRTRNHHNCYSFSFMYDRVIDPGEASGKSIYDPTNPGKISIGLLKEAVLSDAIVRGKHVQYIDEKYVEEYKSSLPTGSYLIAGRVSTDMKDYHFAVMNGDGIWIDKPGSQESRFGVLDGFADVWDTGDYQYTGTTIYFIFTP